MSDEITIKKLKDANNRIYDEMQHETKLKLFKATIESQAQVIVRIVDVLRTISEYAYTKAEQASGTISTSEETAPSAEE